MNGSRWTLDDLHKAERAFDRHRAQVASGEYQVKGVIPEPACDRGCAVCDLCCAIIADALADIRHGLATQARQGAPAWELRHAGRAFSQTAGRA